MDRNQCLQLIELYAANKWLWDARDPNYTNRGMREDSWLDISRKMKIPVKDLKKKMESLLGSYRREKSRVKKSQATGSGYDDVYKSTWYAYDHFAFLADRHDPGNTRDTLDDDETDTNDSVVCLHSPMPTVSDNIRVVDDTTDTQSEGIQQTQQHSQSGDRTNNPQVSKKRSKKKTSKNIDDICNETINDAYKLLQQCASSESQSAKQTDTYSAFGEYIANELRKYDPLTLAHVKKDICGIIFRADTGIYQQYGYFTEGHDFRQPSNFASSYACPSRSPPFLHSDPNSFTIAPPITSTSSSSTSNNYASTPSTSKYLDILP